VHRVPSEGYYTGDNFKKNWSGRLLSDLDDHENEDAEE
jgi:hypothetical protein